MSSPRLWARISRFVLVLQALVGLGFFAALPAGAQTLLPFAKGEYYLGTGGTPPSLEAFAAEPTRYVRSPAAYAELKRGFETALGKPLSDIDFRLLLMSNQVRLVPCSGRITTAGIALSGRVGWSERDCYRGEELIEVETSSGWVVVASRGCFNLVRPRTPPLANWNWVCRQVPLNTAPTDPGSFQFVPGIVLKSPCGCETYYPGTTITREGDMTQSRGYTTVCGPL